MLKNILFYFSFRFCFLESVLPGAVVLWWVTSTWSPPATASTPSSSSSATSLRLASTSTSASTRSSATGSRCRSRRWPCPRSTSTRSTSSLCRCVWLLTLFFHLLPKLCSYFYVRLIDGAAMIFLPPMLQLGIELTSV